MGRPGKIVSIYAARGTVESSLRMAFRLRGFRVADFGSPCDVGVVVAEFPGDGAEHALDEMSRAAGKTILLCLRTRRECPIAPHALLFSEGSVVPFADVLEQVKRLARKRSRSRREGEEL